MGKMIKEAKEDYAKSIQIMEEMLKEAKEMHV
jgi:hypothetical protein